MKQFLLCLIAFLLLSGATLSAQDHEYSEVLEKTDVDSYGGSYSIGPSILGDGLGIVGRKIFPSKNQLELGLAYRGTVLYVELPNNEIDILNYYHGISVLPAFNLYMGTNVKTKKHDVKIKRHYLSFKGGYYFSYLDHWQGVVSWHKERFKMSKNPKYAASLDLGLILYGDRRLSSGQNVIPRSGAGLYLRIDWAFFRP